MLANLQRTTVMFRLMLAVLLAVAPLVSTAPVASASDETHQVASHDKTPCDMPCSGCDQDKTPDCAAKCSAVLMTGLCVETSATPTVSKTQIAAVLEQHLTSRDREPEKPPPRFHLA